MKVNVFIKMKKDLKQIVNEFVAETLENRLEYPKDGSEPLLTPPTFQDFINWLNEK